MTDRHHRNAQSRLPITRPTMQFNRFSICSPP